MVRSGVHEQHAEEHDMARNTARLGVVNLDGKHWSNLGSLDVEEAVEKLALESGQWGFMVMTDLT